MTPIERQQKFYQVSRNLTALAERLAAEHPDFPKIDFGRAYLVVALSLLLEGVGPADTSSYLRELADKVEAGAAELLDVVAGHA